MPDLRRLICTIGALSVVASGPSSSQEPSAHEQQAIKDVYACLAPGLPEGWSIVRVTVALSAPGASTGDVEYLASKGGAEDPGAPFPPCDLQRTPNIVLSLRDRQPEDRRGWYRVRITLFADGHFALTYDYPD